MVQRPQRLPVAQVPDLPNERGFDWRVFAVVFLLVVAAAWAWGRRSQDARAREPAPAAVEPTQTSLPPDRYPPVSREEVHDPAEGSKNTTAYKDNGDGTVSDPALKLTWQRGDSGADLNWALAKDYCQQLQLAGGSWRLPTAQELVTLIDRSRPLRHRIAQVFQNSEKWLWSGSAYQPSASNAWIVDFNYGNSSGSLGITYGYRVRCVR